MSDEHDHHDHAHEPHGAAPAPDDAGSQALAEALRSSFAIVKFVMVVLVVIFFGSGFFQVGTQEKAIILRFGKPVGEGPQALLGPGLHWSFPYPIDEVVKIPITEIQKVTSTHRLVCGDAGTGIKRQPAAGRPFPDSGRGRICDYRRP